MIALMEYTRNLLNLSKWGTEIQDIHRIDHVASE